MKKTPSGSIPDPRGVAAHTSLLQSNGKNPSAGDGANSHPLELPLPPGRPPWKVGSPGEAGQHSANTYCVACLLNPGILELHQASE